MGIKDEAEAILRNQPTLNNIAKAKNYDVHIRTLGLHIQHMEERIMELEGRLNELKHHDAHLKALDQIHAILCEMGYAIPCAFMGGGSVQYKDADKIS